VISDIAETHEDLDKCKNLSRQLELYSSNKREDVQGFSNSYGNSLKQRRSTLDALKDPKFVPNYKFVDNSKILQLAFLDKIIEECDDDQKNNAIGGMIQKTHSFIDKQVQKIQNDDLKVELDIKKDDDFEYQLKFE
jgi:hypothetical protein